MYVCASKAWHFSWLFILFCLDQFSYYSLFFKHHSYLEIRFIMKVYDVRKAE